MRGCAWIVIVAILAAVSLGYVPLWLLGVLAAPAAYVVGHWRGWRGAVAVMEESGHIKASRDADALRDRWQL